MIAISERAYYQVNEELSDDCCSIHKALGRWKQAFSDLYTKIAVDDITRLRKDARETEGYILDGSRCSKRMQFTNNVTLQRKGAEGISNICQLSVEQLGLAKRGRVGK